MDQQNTNPKDLEGKIILTARRLFIEKGYNETSMSDIAAALGINRPTLHYYFRTKDKMFQAIFKDVIGAILPKVSLIFKEETSIEEKISLWVDTYMDNFMENPDLPVFFTKEIQRDPDNLIKTIYDLELEKYLMDLISIIQDEKKKGVINDVPIFAIFYTLFGLISGPFLTRRMAEGIFISQGGQEENSSVWKISDDFKHLMDTWKPYVKAQIENLLVKKK